jgi:hypothetical protein
VRERWVAVLAGLLLAGAVAWAALGGSRGQVGALLLCGGLLGLAEGVLWCWQETRADGLAVPAGSPLPLPAWGWSVLVLATATALVAALLAWPAAAVLAGLLVLVALGGLRSRPRGSGPARADVVRARVVQRRLAGHGGPVTAEVSRSGPGATSLVGRAADGTAAGVLVADAAQAGSVAALLGVAPVATG